MRCELVKQTKLPRGKIGQATWRILNILYYIGRPRKVKKLIFCGLNN